MLQTRMHDMMGHASSYTQEHAVRLFIYMYPAEPWKNRPENEGEAMREIKQDKDLLKRVADICTTCTAPDGTFRSALKETLLTDDVVNSRYRTLQAKSIRNSIKAHAGQTEHEDAIFNSMMSRFPASLDWLCGNIASYVSEARRYFNQRRAD